MRLVVGRWMGSHLSNARVEGTSPGWMSIADDRVVGLSLHEGITHRFGRPEDKNVTWSVQGNRAEIPLLGEPGADILAVGSVLGQQVGAFWLLQPLSGALPWYVVDSPPPSARALPVDAEGRTAAPETVVSSAPADDRMVRGPWGQRTLPDGEIRQLSPWWAEITGMHSGHSAFRRASSQPLKSAIPKDGKPMDLLDGADRRRVRDTLATFGIRLVRAWSVQVSPDRADEIVYEGRLGSLVVRGVVDRREAGSGVRLFVYRAGGGTSPLRFEHDGRTWVGWTGDAKGMEALHVDGRGLIRSWTPASTDPATGG